MSHDHGAPQAQSNPPAEPQPPYLPAYQPPQFGQQQTQQLPPFQPGQYEPGQFGQQQPGPAKRKTLAIVLGSVAVAVGIALIVLFAWLIPSFTKVQAQGETTPSASATDAPTGAADEPSAAPSAPGTASSEIPAGAVALPAGWEQLDGPGNVPADGDARFSKWVTGESSFQYLAEWTHDESFGITKDPTSGEEIQKKAQGTVEADGDGIALAFAFFAESQEGKFGTDPGTVKAAIEGIRAKFTAMPAAELPANLVGHKCSSDFQTSKPEIREFRRGAAVVIGFTCTNARGEVIEAVNLFTVTPWGTPQMLGVSGHHSYWETHPGLMEQLGNSYRINRWKMAG
ncbi:hypothetical protein [Arthrobacter sp. CJ23]|uniref:hypothetical protein n=1 Tax=Arthrobacter sp. CJ23 TaxID=2972479 RepID=UPI00215CACCA|nr:hypothetical protein [Arthrobacter sp. CJ23]UVJ40063.1 hypothetical protein NVV90_02380 [Arthrobacter sp. CJ23]